MFPWRASGITRINDCVCNSLMLVNMFYKDNHLSLGVKGPDVDVIIHFTYSIELWQLWHKSRALCPGGRFPPSFIHE